MSFSTPTFPDLVQRAQADIATRLPGADAGLPNSVLDVLTQIQACAAHGLHQHLDWVSRQILPDTADEETVTRWASLFGIPRSMGVVATGSITFSGKDGSSILTGSVLQADTGVEYTTDVAALIAGGTATVAATARKVGASANQPADTVLTLVNTQSGINSQPTVAAGSLTGGVEAETIERLRQRLLARLRQAPQGGAAHDYVAWALAGHPDVTRAWCYPNQPAIGKVTVHFVTDNLPSVIPDAGTVAAVDDHIQARRPVAARVTVVAPTPVPLNITLASLTPNTAAVQAAITAELRDLLSRQATPGGTLRISQIREAISIAAGETDYAMTDPVADITHATSEIATLGAITWP